MNALKNIPLSQLIHSDKNPRTVSRASEGIAELAASIAAEGVLQPLIVRATGKEFVILAGHRRHVAAGVAGLASVPCVVSDTDTPRPVLHLVENLQRQDLTAAQTAIAVYEVLKSRATKQKTLAASLGMSETWVSKCKAVGQWFDKDDRSAYYLDPYATYTLDYLYLEATKEAREAQLKLKLEARLQAHTAAMLSTPPAIANSNVLEQGKVNAPKIDADRTPLSTETTSSPVSVAKPAPAPAGLHSEFRRQIELALKATANEVNPPFRLRLAINHMIGGMRHSMLDEAEDLEYLERSIFGQRST